MTIQHTETLQRLWERFSRDQLAGHMPVNLSATLRSAFVLPNPIRVRSYALFMIGHDEILGGAEPHQAQA